MKLGTILIIAGAAGAVAYTGYHFMKTGEQRIKSADLPDVVIFKQYWKYWVITNPLTDEQIKELGDTAVHPDQRQITKEEYKAFSDKA